MAVIDDKSEHCVPFILDLLKQHREKYGNEGTTPPPFFLGLNGVQGAGKTTLVRPSNTPSSPFQEDDQ
jgi:D-glycerate 3-kinase